MSQSRSRKVLIVGAGMIAHDQILPSILHLQRLGQVSEVEVCSTRPATIENLGNAAFMRDAFPGQTFAGYSGSAGIYQDRIRALPERSIVVVATPDPLHYEMVMAVLAADQHVICVKPLVLKLVQALEIDRFARTRSLFVGVDYHKRFDDRSLMARRGYREGRFGEFRLGAAWLLEKWHYRRSNFQNWFTRENSDAFTYIGCHYVDLVAFITGLRPVSVSVFGIADRFPNGAEGFLWTDARVIWNNGACLNVQNALGFPDTAPGTNAQGLTLYCAGNAGGALIAHSDQYRGLKYGYADGEYAEPSPDYFQYVEWIGPGLKPVGYGYRSIKALVEACGRETVDADLIATPGNSWYNEAVIEAARESLGAGGKSVECARPGDAAGL
jgi:predicted dehydrogenase